jgi:hypothetical protein
MAAGQYHNNIEPTLVVGTTAQKQNYQLIDRENMLVGPAGSQQRANYTHVKCRNGLVYHFLIPGGMPGGQAIQIIPFQDANNNWPSLTYTLQGTIDGVNFVALPTPVTGVAVTNTQSVAHLLLLPFSAYNLTVTGASDNGFFSVIASV